MAGSPRGGLLPPAALMRARTDSPPQGPCCWLGVMRPRPPPQPQGDDQPSPTPPVPMPADADRINLWQLLPAASRPYTPVTYLGTQRRQTPPSFASSCDADSLTLLRHRQEEAERALLEQRRLLAARQALDWNDHTYRFPPAPSSPLGGGGRWPLTHGADFRPHSRWCRPSGGTAPAASGRLRERPAGSGAAVARALGRAPSERSV
eukprot:TRINITY_DN52138_c0_g1_i1.p1 TRINITY_DN52138_c0_g1~~TRINITY_DN52138_c0_g1_i1.p1  ORF type:complete len:206 (+),score=17.19 TRINITY_DN52138_c0_g1_i1:82-699(+)